jgi:adenosylcobinamide-GDP ribazoletransferase
MSDESAGGAPDTSSGEESDGTDPVGQTDGTGSERAEDVGDDATADQPSGGDVPPRDASPGPASGSAGVQLALSGALGFLSRVPVGTDLRSWEAFRRAPWAFVFAGYLVGTLVALPFAVTVVVPIPAATVALLYLLALVAVTGINHADGVADLADAAAITGDREARYRVLKDSDVGVGGTAALAGLVAGLALAAFTLAGLPALQAAGIVLASEVSAKLGMALLACLGDAPFDGLGAQLTRVSTDQDTLAPVLLAVPAAFASWPSAGAGGALVVGVVAALATWRWGASLLGGVNGDVFGAANELGRLAALHAGVVVWTLS